MIDMVTPWLPMTDSCMCLVEQLTTIPVMMFIVLILIISPGLSFLLPLTPRFHQEDCSTQEQWWVMPCSSLEEPWRTTSGLGRCTGSSWPPTPGAPWSRTLGGCWSPTSSLTSTLLWVRQRQPLLPT